MATTKPKKTASKAKSSTKAKTTAKAPKTAKVSKPAVVAAEKKVEQKVDKKQTNAVKEFFAKKYTAEESILTIFKDKKLYGALIGEVFGTMLISMVLLTLGLYNPLYLIFVVVAATAVVYTLSGAHLNPLVTVGMMASRRVSVIRGVLYIIAQILGAWIGLIIINAFRLAGGELAELPAMAAIDNFWLVAMIELLGAVIIGFFFARAQQYKRSALTFASVIGGGVLIAFVIVLMISNYCSLSNNFILNPAMALMFQILPTSGETAGELLGGIGLALLTYMVFPMIGGVLGFYISDIAGKLKGENLD